MKKKLLYVVNVDWFFISHRLPLAIEAINQGYEVHIATHLSNHKEQLEEAGLIVHNLPISRSSLSVFSLFSFFLKLKKIFQDLKPDIVHLVTIKPVLVGGIAARLFKVPAVVSAISGLGYIFLDQGILALIRRSLVQFLYRLALAHKNIIVIFQNEDDKKIITSYTKLSDKNISLIGGSGANINTFYYEQPSTKNLIALLPARLLKDKGILEFVEAARILKVRNVKVTFVLAGNIDYDNPSSISKKELDSWISEGIIEYWGFRDNMCKTLAQSSIVVLPSYREGFPKVLMEAAAKGRAIITTDVPGCRDAIINNITGILVPPKNSDLLANAIQYLIEDPEKIISMGREGRDLAEKKFDEAIIIQKHLDGYERLISNIS
jgi:glycosyltransferase involved in cell wall biosynthesis